MIQHTEQQNKKWFAVYTRNKHEKVVDTQLSKLGIETFLPIREQLSQWKDRKKIIETPLFPGYLFTCIDLKQDYLKVLSTKGVVTLLGINGIPQSIPDDEVQSLKYVMKSNYKYDPYASLQKGVKVIVVRGPLEGTVGDIVKKSGKFKLKVSVELIKSSIIMDIDASDVEVVQ
jgi:transcription antitermination factor NusG